MHSWICSWSIGPLLPKREPTPHTHHMLYWPRQTKELRLPFRIWIAATPMWQRSFRNIRLVKKVHISFGRGSLKNIFKKLTYIRLFYCWQKLISGNLWNNVSIRRHLALFFPRQHILLVRPQMAICWRWEQWAEVVNSLSIKGGIPLLCSAPFVAKSTEATARELGQQHILS